MSRDWAQVADHVMRQAAWFADVLEQTGLYSDEIPRAQSSYLTMMLQLAWLRSGLQLMHVHNGLCDAEVWNLSQGYVVTIGLRRDLIVGMQGANRTLN